MKRKLKRWLPLYVVKEKEMSGIFVTVWDEKARDNTELLKPTRGGWPHLTLAYTGKVLTLEELRLFASLVMVHVGKPLVLRSAYVNSFPLESEHHDVRLRHDVLLQVDDEDMERLRLVLKLLFPKKHKQFNMQPLHISYRVNYPSLKEAQEEIERLNTLLPHTVTITGVTLD